MNKEVYISKIADLDKEYEVLNAALIKNRADRAIWQKLLNEQTKDNVEFPVNARRDKKIVFILSKVIKRAATISDLEDNFNTLNGKPEKLPNIMRRLKDEGVLVSVRYNRTNRMTFWGLSEWIGEGDFKQQYKPLDSVLPLSINNVEIL